MQLFSAGFGKAPQWVERIFARHIAQLTKCLVGIGVGVQDLSRPAAHAATMEGVGGWRFAAVEVDGGAALTVRVPLQDAPKLSGLGFLGVMTHGHKGAPVSVALEEGRTAGLRPDVADDIRRQLGGADRARR